MNNEDITILIVEDDVQIRNFICFTLEQERFKYESSGSVKEALFTIANKHIDLILLDLGLPDADGIQLIKKVREWSVVPIIVVSARDQEMEKAAVLDSGADDYLTKPFSAIELSARIRVAIRHFKRGSEERKQSVLSVGDLSIDLSRHLVFLKDIELHVTPLEYSLLSVLFKNIGKVLTTHYIIKEIYGPNYGTDTQALRALMAGLRRKIEANPAKPRYILTEIGVGYRLVDE